MNLLKSTSIAAILSLAVVMPSAYAVKNGETFKSWKGHCDKFKGKEICSINQTVLSSDKKPMADIHIRRIKDKKADFDMIAFIKVPLGVQLRAGLGIKIDNKDIARVPYELCDPAGCNVIVPLNGKFIEALKAGSKMQVIVYTDKERKLTASLSGITNALNSL